MQKVVSNNNHQTLIEFLYDECLKKYGNNKLADKKMMQIIAAAHYHCNTHTKILHFSKFLQVETPIYSNEVLNYYLLCVDKLVISNQKQSLIKDERTETDLTYFSKAQEVLKDIVDEKLPMEIGNYIKQ